MESAARGRAIDPAHELAMLRRGALVLAGRNRRLEPLRERLDRRAVAEILEPLACGRADALLLLADVRHRVKKTRCRAGAAMVAEHVHILGAWTSERAAGSPGRRRSSRSQPDSRGSSVSSEKSSPPTTSARTVASTPSRLLFRFRTSSARSLRTRRCPPRSFLSSPNCWK